MAKGEPTESPGAAAVVSEARRKRKPLWSTLKPGFIAEKTRSADGHEGMDEGGARQVENTLHLWRAIIGDRRMDEYEAADAGIFRDTMLRLPASHGKGGTRATVRAEVPPLEAIRRADERQKAVDARNALLPTGAERELGIKRLKMKTLKKHFSRLSQFWIYAGRHGHVAREPNVFRGWEYQGVRRGLKKRGRWSSEDLSLLVGSTWFAPENTDKW